MTQSGYGALGVPGHHGHRDVVTDCLAPWHWAQPAGRVQQPGPRHARMMTVRSAQCQNGAYYLFTACVQLDCQFPMVTKDSRSWYCRGLHRADGVLCPRCDGIGVSGVSGARYITCRKDDSHLYAVNSTQRCRQCRIGLFLATDRSGYLPCQVCGGAY